MNRLENFGAHQRNPWLVVSSILLTVGLLMLLYLIDETFLQEKYLVVKEEYNISNYETLNKKYYEAYKIWTIDENVRAFDWHLRSTKIIFWISMMIGVSGIAFSFWQFIEASKEEKHAIKSDQLEIRTQLISLAFKSRSIAAFVMFISIAYILIYVILVYPINFVPMNLAAPQASLHTTGDRKRAVTERDQEHKTLLGGGKNEETNIDR